MLYGVSHASLDRPHRLRNQRKESSQRRFRAALSCLFPFPFYFLHSSSELLSILLYSDASRSALDRVKDAIAYIAESVSTSQITLGVHSSLLFRSFLDRHAQNQEEKHASAGILTSRAHPAPAEGAGPRGSAVRFVGGGRGGEGSKRSEGSDAARADGGGSEIRGESGERKATDGTDRQPAAAAKAAETPAREREKWGRERGNEEGVDGMQ